MYAIVDIETTGGNASTNRIIEIAIVLFDGVSVTGVYETLINPEIPIPRFITGLTGITDGMVNEAPVFAEVASHIHSLLHQKVFIAHNVNFDYSFVKKEFEACALPYNSKRLCSVRLSRKLIPGLKSYSLGNLCRSIGIVNKNPHRAAGDAIAAAELFQKLLLSDHSQIILSAIKKTSGEAVLPPQLSKEEIDNLPAASGVYSFYNSKGVMLYVGKALDIKKRVWSHFQTNSTTAVKTSFIKEIASVKFTLCGNELISLLLESEMIKTKWPRYNSAQKKPAIHFGVFQYEDRNGYLRFGINKTTKKNYSLTFFRTLPEAREFVSEVIKKHELCAKLAGLQFPEAECYDYQHNYCKGACIGAESTVSYNTRHKVALSSFLNEDETFIIIGKGRERTERSIVLIERGKYKGFGFIPSRKQVKRVNQVLPIIRLCHDNSDVQSIIRYWLANKESKVVFLENDKEQLSTPVFASSNSAVNLFTDCYS